MLCFSEMKSPRHYYEVIVEGKCPLPWPSFQSSQTEKVSLAGEPGNESDAHV